MRPWRKANSARALCTALALVGRGRIEFESVSIDAGSPRDARTDFDAGDAQLVDGAMLDDAGSDAATVDGGRSCATRAMRWEAEFDVIPTSLDGNSDGMADWILRSGEPFDPAELADGVWTTTSQNALDTNPPYRFVGQTHIEVGMRSTGPDLQRGAVFWINVDPTPTDYVPIFVALIPRPDGTRDLELNVFSGTAHTFLSITTVRGLPDRITTIALDIDAPADAVRLTVEGVDRGTFSYPRADLPTEYLVGTAIALESAPAEFDFVRI